MYSCHVPRSDRFHISQHFEFNLEETPVEDMLQDVAHAVKLQEGTVVLENIMLSLMLNTGLSTKELALKVLLPVPVIAAIKNELKKRGLVAAQGNGTILTHQGRVYVERTLGYAGLDIPQYTRFKNGTWDMAHDFASEQPVLAQIFAERPQVDVSIDQSKCTIETSLRRAVLCLQHGSLVGKRILCIGDDDLVSISLGVLLKKVIPERTGRTGVITVLDIDSRFTAYISHAAQMLGLPIDCQTVDVRQPLPDVLQDQYDCFLTDPPYTLPGMELFLSRGIEALKQQPDLAVFFSFAHKPPGFTLNMQRSLLDMGLIITEVIPRFSQYEGAGIIAGTGQMMILHTTSKTSPMVKEAFEGAIYTGELRCTVRSYRCMSCQLLIEVGTTQEIKTIEALKAASCPACHGQSFELRKRTATPH